MRSLFAAPALLLAACTALGPMDCSDGERPAVTETLYFGTARAAGGAVSDEDWAAFLRDVVTPRFPEGFTAWPGSGQWRGASGAIVTEKSFVVSIVHSPGDDSPRKVAEIVSQYKARFGQEAVLRVASGACFSF